MNVLKALLSAFIADPNFRNASAAIEICRSSRCTTFYYKELFRNVNTHITLIEFHLGRIFLTFKASSCFCCCPSVERRKYFVIHNVHVLTSTYRPKYALSDKQFVTCIKSYMFGTRCHSQRLNITKLYKPALQPRFSSPL